MRGDSPLFSETSASPENKKSWGRYQLPPTPQSVLSPPGPWRVSVLLESSGPPPLELLVLAQPVVAPDVVFPEQPPVLPGLRVQLLQLLGGAHIHLEQPDGKWAGVGVTEQPPSPWLPYPIPDTLGTGCSSTRSLGGQLTSGRSLPTMSQLPDCGTGGAPIPVALGSEVGTRQAFCLLAIVCAALPACKASPPPHTTFLNLTQFEGWAHGDGFRILPLLTEPRAKLPLQPPTAGLHQVPPCLPLPSTLPLAIHIQTRCSCAQGLCTGCPHQLLKLWPSTQVLTYPPTPQGSPPEISDAIHQALLAQS